MPYCRRCGTKLEDDARFCHKCGTPTAIYTQTFPTAPTPKPVPLRKDPIVIGAIILVSILVVGVVVAALFAASVASVNVNQTIQDSTANVNKLNFNFESGGARINIFTQKISNNNFVFAVEGSAYKNAFSGSGNPVEISVSNGTDNGVETIFVKLIESASFSRYDLVCNIYINPDLAQNLNVTSAAGQISFTADKPTTFESLRLQTSAGTVEANLQKSTIKGNVTVRTQAGTVDFQTNQIILDGNSTIDLHSNAGSVNMDITQTKQLQGNLQVNAATELGSVNIGITIDGDVAAKIASQTNLGSINTNLQHFSGSKNLVQSDNYPAVSNIDIAARTSLGSIDINAAYQSSSGPSLSN